MPPSRQLVTAPPASDHEQVADQNLGPRPVDGGPATSRQRTPAAGYVCDPHRSGPRFVCACATHIPPPHSGRVAHKAAGPIRKGGRQTTATATAAGPEGSSDRVVVLGGGFGGLYTALRLAELSAAPSSKPLHLTLVDANDKFTFLPLLYELCTGRAGLSEVAPAFQDLLEASS